MRSTDPKHGALIRSAFALMLAVTLGLGASSPSLAQFRPPPRESGTTLPPLRYGDAGTMHLAFGIGLGVGTFGTSYAGNVAYNYFVVNAVGPGIDVGISGGDNLLTVLSTAATLRLLPIRTEAVDVLITPRFGRLFMLEFEDFWAAGATAGVIFWPGGRVGLQLGYRYERLFGGPCGELRQGCNLHGTSFGIVVGF